MARATTRARGVALRALCVAAGLMLCLPALARDPAGEVQTITGRATAASPDGTVRALDKGTPFFSGETINTGPNTYVRLRFTDESFVVLRPNSRFQIEDYQHTGEPEEERGFFSLLKGGFRAVTGLIGKLNRKNYRVSTGMATIGIRGTDYETRVCAGDCLDVFPAPADGLYVGVVHNQVLVVTSPGGQETLMGTGDYIACLAAGGGCNPISPQRGRRIMGLPPADPAQCPSG